MFAIVNTPKGTAPLEIREVVEPQAAPHEAIVEVRAFSLNRGELALLAARSEGWRPGQDVAGVVVQRAADGSGPDVGTRIVGMAEQGGWAQRVAVDTDRLTTLPENVSFAQAAAVPMAGHTALRILRFGDPLEGKRVLITGAAGGVGHFAVQLAALGGADVIGVVGNPERGSRLRELGVSDLVTQIEQAKGPFDLILESVGGTSLTAALGLVAAHGTIVVFGNSSGEDIPFNLFHLFGHEGARLQTFFSYNPGTSIPLSEDLTQLVTLIKEDKITVPLGLEHDWRELAPALTMLKNRQVQGKAIFYIG